MMDKSKVVKKANGSLIGATGVAPGKAAADAHGLPNAAPVHDEGAFLQDMKAIRARARISLGDGALTANYVGSVQDAIALLNHAVAAEIVCVLRYKFHAVTATGIASESVKAEFAQHAAEEGEHLDLLAERINQLGGKPDLNPAGLLSRAGTEYVEGESLVDMIKENLVAERIAVETYRQMVRYFGERDPTTRVLLEKILAMEEEHANEMHDLLVVHEGRPTAGG
jgi:bacterioferritin